MKIALFIDYVLDLIEQKTCRMKKSEERKLDRYY